MARLIFEKAQILDASGSAVAGEEIFGITVDGLELSKEATTVEIEDGRTLNESFTGSITVRSIHSGFGATGSGTDILASNYVSGDGSVTSTKAGLKLVGANSGTSVQITDVYIMGHRDFTNGRLETVITASGESTNQNIVTTA